MTADAFRRLAVLVGCTAYGLAIALIARYFGWAVCIAAVTIGVLLALVVTFEQSQGSENVELTVLPRTARNRMRHGARPE